ncbi:MAG: TetR/AcrR family transcriptional regulator C-terminal domain-containing protein [Microthrixaceae bacterium]
MARSSRLSPEAIVTTALQLVDEEGLAALSMRRLARRLSVEAMSLYHHVRSKEALLDALVERLWDDVELNLDATHWEESMRQGMTVVRRGLLSHPNLLPVVATRPIMSQNPMVLVELSMAALVEVGFTPERSRQIVNVLVSFAVGHALAEVGASPMIFDGYDRDTVTRHRSTLPPDQLPLVASTFGSSPEDRDAEFQLGVDCLIRGLAAELELHPAPLA